MSAEPQVKPQVKPQWQYASLVSGLGKWAWIFGLINGIIEIIFALYNIGLGIPLGPYGVGLIGTGVWYLIGAVILIFISFTIIIPKFSNKCAEKDWEALYGWTLDLGGVKVPWMLIWGIIFTAFSWYYWGGLFVLLPTFLLLFMGPRPYNWS